MPLSDSLAPLGIPRSLVVGSGLAALFDLVTAMCGVTDDNFASPLSAGAIRFSASFPKPPPEPLREAASIQAPVAVQTTGRALYKQPLATAVLPVTDTCLTPCSIISPCRY